MRRALLLLLAGTAAPAIAQPLDSDRARALDERREASAERREAVRQQRQASRVADEEQAPRARSASPERAQRLVERFVGAGRQEGSVAPAPERRRTSEASLDAERAPPGVRVIEAPAGGAVERLRRPRLTRQSISETPAASDAPRPSRPAREAIADAPGVRVIEAPGTRRRTGDSVADWRLRDRGSGTTPQLVEEREGSTPEAMRDPVRRRIESFVGGSDAPVVSRVPRAGTQPPEAVTRRLTRFVSDDWRSQWRRDRRYDWHGWRRRHRDRFHLGFYFDPFGWGYRRYHAGWRLWPAYYGRSFWLHDAWYYRLPYAPPGYRWIRYYDDAVLVDTWDGRVADVIHNFFW